MLGSIYFSLLLNIAFFVLFCAALNVLSMIRPNVVFPRRFLYYTLGILYIICQAVWYAVFWVLSSALASNKGLLPLGSKVQHVAFKVAKYAQDTGYLQQQFMAPLCFGLVTFLVIYLLIIRFDWLRGFHAVKWFDRFLKWQFMLLSMFSLLVTLMVVSIILKYSYKFLDFVPLKDFLFGTEWAPNQYDFDKHSAFGLLPVLFGTVFVSAIALFFAFPLGVLVAVFLSQYCGRVTSRIIKAALEVLAGVPTIVYGFFAAFFLSPMFVKFMYEGFGVRVSLENYLIPGLTIGLMVLPYIATLIDDAISAVPQNMSDSALAIGMSKYEVVMHIILPHCHNHIIDTIILAASRAVGETMVVVISCGTLAIFSINPLDQGTTITVQIAHLLTGDSSFGSPKVLSAFALSGVLLILSASLNALAMLCKKK